ncbi:MAG: glycosyltransferase family 2 protein [Clostridiales bacterium]|nr:glycosyltransferase family 2 protein [Clostridiales bacterium]
MKVSVVVCTYNGEKYISDQLKSIVAQTRKVDEIILCDDNSTDQTVDIADGILKESGIPYRFIVRNKNVGVVENFYSGIMEAQGDYIFTCDQDDIWELNKVEIFSKEAGRSSKLLYFSNGYIVDSDGETVIGDLWKSYLFDFTNSSNMTKVLLNHCVVTGAAMMISKDIIHIAGRIPDGWLHDSWFAIIASLNDSIVPINNKTFRYRQHSNNVVGTRERNVKAKIQSWLKNFQVLKRVRTKEYIRYKALNDVDSPKYNKEINGCIEFWHDLTMIENSGLLRSIKIVMRHQLNGDYKKYQYGFRSSFRDFISCFSR